MKRRYDRNEYANRINTLRKYIPDVTLTTDIMVGFPGETEKDFADSCEFVQTLKFNKLHIFPYSDRDGTAASKMSDKISPEITRERKKKLAEIDHDLHLQWLYKAVGQNKQVLTETLKKDSELVQGTTKDYYKVNFIAPDLVKNALANVKIIAVDEEKLCLTGQLASL